MDRLEELRARFQNEPFVQFLGVTLENLEMGYAVVGLTVTKNILIVDQMVNGGFLAVLGNSASVYAAMSVIPAGHTRNLHMEIHFLKPGREGEFLRAVAKVEDETGSYIWAKFDILGPDDKPCARGSILYLKPKVS